MRPIKDMPAEICRTISTIFSDIDDTMTTHGRIPPTAFSALWKATEAGIRVIPVTGRPAGWCDHIARMWPVSAVVGENGALAFALVNGRIQRLYAERPADAAQRLSSIQRRVLAEVPGCRVATDQAYREYDLAIDFCEDVPPLGEPAIDKIVAIFEEAGATAKVSSIHVNGWFGDFDKLSMCKHVSETLFGQNLDAHRATFLGDSPNDVPMFAFFNHAIGVANVKEMAHRMETLPAYLCENRGGEGFAEAVSHILRHR